MNQYVCECVAGYTGTNCELNINECADDPCLNGGTCNVSTSRLLTLLISSCILLLQDLINQYSCSCVTGFVGNNCEGHECDSTPCLNNGTCVMTTDNTGYICDCVSGFEVTDIQYILYYNCKIIYLLLVLCFFSGDSLWFRY